jgi:hypothetical protein
MSPVRYELRVFIQDDGIPHSHHREKLKSCIALTIGLCNGDVMCFL